MSSNRAYVRLRLRTGFGMPKYFFTIRAGHDGAHAERAAELSNDADALAYATKLARELLQTDKRTDTGWLVKVRDEKRPMVLAIPLFAACA
jgi:hypothetical protein